VSDRIERAQERCVNDIINRRDFVNREVARAEVATEVSNELNPRAVFEVPPHKRSANFIVGRDSMDAPTNKVDISRLLSCS
jgi:hypothetical protein